jgi:hypothetical protein
MYSVPLAKCGYHASRPAVAHCTICGRAVCHSCAQPDNLNRPVCRPCCLYHGMKQRPSGGVTALGVINIVWGGLLKLREWARELSLVYGVARLVTVTISLLVDAFWLLPAMRAAGASEYMVSSMIFGMVVVIISAPIYPIVLLAFLTRPMVKVQFGRQLKNWTPPSAA